jgi:hypothetical protein
MMKRAMRVKTKKQSRTTLIFLLFSISIVSTMNLVNQIYHIYSRRTLQKMQPMRQKQFRIRSNFEKKNPSKALESIRSTNLQIRAIPVFVKDRSQRVPPHVEFSQFAEELTTKKTSISGAKYDIGDALCIQGARWYGRTFNRILEIANALAILADNSNDLLAVSDVGSQNDNNMKQTRINPIQKETFIGISPSLSEWYEEFLDLRPDIVLNYTGPCLSTWMSKDLFHHNVYKNSRKSRQQIQKLVPKESHRVEAEHAIAAYSKMGQQQVISVHRRHLEGMCVKKATQGSVACINRRVRGKLSTKELLDTCNYDYNMVRAHHAATIDNNESVVVLFTDNEVPALDETFPIRSNYSFPVEAWMMTQSDVHYGNPHSTVDLVVAIWRGEMGRTTHPSACYDTASV